MGNLSENSNYKFGRNYALAITGSFSRVLNVDPNLTIEFEVYRSTFNSANTAKVRIYNLSEAHRNEIQFNVIQAVSEYRSFLLRAGYGTNLPIIFAGNVSECYSVREGSNFITTVECLDGGFAFVNGFLNATYPGSNDAPTPYTTVMRDAINNSFPHVSVGAIGSFEGGLIRDNSYSQRTIDFLDELTGSGMFVDNQKAYCLKDNEVITGQVDKINAASGLLNTPFLQQTILTFDMIFEPGLLVSQLVTLESMTAQSFNGDYKIISLRHRGTISPAVSGEAITSVGLQSFREFIKVGLG